MLYPSSRAVNTVAASARRQQTLWRLNYAVSARHRRQIQGFSYDLQPRTPVNTTRSSTHSADGAFSSRSETAPQADQLKLPCSLSSDRFPPISTVLCPSLGFVTHCAISCTFEKGARPKASNYCIQTLFLKRPSERLGRSIRDKLGKV